MAEKTEPDDASRRIADNRKAFHDYHVLDPQEVRDLLGQRRVRAAGKNLQLAKPGRHQSFTAQGSSHRWVS